MYIYLLSFFILYMHNLEPSASCGKRERAHLANATEFNRRYLMSQSLHREDLAIFSDHGDWRIKSPSVSTGGPHKLCDRLYFEFIEEMYGNVKNLCIIVLDCDKYAHLTSK